jgi:hypothetical protein
VLAAALDWRDPTAAPGVYELHLSDPRNCFLKHAHLPKTAIAFSAPSATVTESDVRLTAADPRVGQTDGVRSFAAGDAPMEFTLLFLAVLIAMLAAWIGPRPLGLALFAVVFVAAVATYLHHASDVLKLSF